MDDKLRLTLITEARKKMKATAPALYDPAHDFNHVYRVLKNAEYIQGFEGGDLDVIVPAALFHDVVVYPKNDPMSLLSPLESAKVAKSILRHYGFSNKILHDVGQVIKEHSFSADHAPSSLESKIIQDADRLEASGAISLMRTFNSGGLMRRPFYNFDDPFCYKRTPAPNEYTLDFFYTRLLKIVNKLNTDTARKMARERNQFLLDFLKRLDAELAFSSADPVQDMKGGIK